MNKEPKVITTKQPLDLVRQAPAFSQLMTHFNVNMPNEVESIWQPLYDKLTYANAGQTNLKFFQTPVGGNGNTVTAEMTNMKAAGQISAPQQMLVTGIQLDFQPSAALAQIHAATPADLQDYVNDVQAVLNSGVVVFTVGNKEQNRDAPIRRFPPSTYLEVDAALSDATTPAAGLTSGISYAQGCGELYSLTPLNIPWAQNFDVTILWDTGVALPSGDDGEITCYLQGYLYRSVQ